MSDPNPNINYPWIDKKVCIVIPVYNEQNRIAKVLSEVEKIYDNVVVVDDFSTDNTLNVLKNFKAKIIPLDKNMGAGYATKSGCDWAIYEAKCDIVITIDGDGQHEPSDIPSLITLLTENKLDVVFGFRPRKKNMPFIKRIGNYTLSKLSSILFKVHVTDTLTGFHAFTKEAYPYLKWEANRYVFVSEYIYRIWLNNLKYGEVGVKTIYNEKEGGMNIRDGIKSIIYMFYWRFLK